jgi:hypothetical protein
MRQLADAALIQSFLQLLGRRARGSARLYLVGGATAVLHGWRESTIDIDVHLSGDEDAILRELPRLKEELRVNVELAAPAQFVPVPPDWAERSPFVVREGTIDVFHYDYLSQALAKAERGHRQDVADVHQMLDRGLVEPDALLDASRTAAGQLYRYPAVDPAAFLRAVEAAVARARNRRPPGRGS